MAGYLYMPLCACLSAVIFRRHYGWLEIHGLGFLTLSIMIFVELGARPWAQGGWGDIHISLYFLEADTLKGEEHKGIQRF